MPDIMPSMDYKRCKHEIASCAFAKDNYIYKDCSDLMLWQN